jgi:hypothetical protein
MHKAPIPLVSLFNESSSLRRRIQLLADFDGSVVASVTFQSPSA